jgi:chromosome segregation ATPase
MDTDDLDQLEQQLHELLLICVDLRKENDELKLQLKQQTAQIDDLEQQKSQVEGKVSHLLSSLGPLEPDHE